MVEHSLFGMLYPETLYNSLEDGMAKELQIPFQVDLSPESSISPNFPSWLRCCSGCPALRFPQLRFHRQLSQTGSMLSIFLPVHIPSSLAGHPSKARAELILINFYRQGSSSTTTLPSLFFLGGPRPICLCDKPSTDFTTDNVEQV